MSSAQLSPNAGRKTPPPEKNISELLAIGLWAYMRHHPEASFAAFQAALERIGRLLAREGGR